MDPAFRTEIDEDEVAKLAAEDPNLAAHPGPAEDPLQCIGEPVEDDLAVQEALAEDYGVTGAEEPAAPAEEVTDRG